MKILKRTESPKEALSKKGYKCFSVHKPTIKEIEGYISTMSHKDKQKKPDEHKAERPTRQARLTRLLIEQ